MMKGLHQQNILYEKAAESCLFFNKLLGNSELFDRMLSLTIKKDPNTWGRKYILKEDWFHEENDRLLPHHGAVVNIDDRMREEEKRSKRAITIAITNHRSKLVSGK